MREGGGEITKKTEFEISSLSERSAHWIFIAFFGSVLEENSQKRNKFFLHLFSGPVVGPTNPCLHIIVAYALVKYTGKFSKHKKERNSAKLKDRLLSCQNGY